ncbi:uncharacterized protein LOC130638846 [Hydractinia symbiolongicarpus]|uniref:uncharacterized protein LOC130638846 n=1 Tax=Hydractinia symbiolongicarpus TaxID=13093 RepID=UPI00254AE410|nr:uncharacterized protein LOC130638846 [Hydractinia symbiolongicarpus]
MTSFKLMPDPLDLREVTFTNLLLLGFNPEANEAQYRIPFTRDMFSVPNRKAMEVVLHFLFTKLNNDSAKETFRNCWPIMDKKKEQEFRKLTMEWLTKIKKDDPDCHLTSLVPSLLLSPMGDKFYQFLFYFSTYILKQKMHVLPSKYSSIPPWPVISSAHKKYLPQVNRALIVSTINQQSRLINHLEETAFVKETWMEFSKELSQEHRKLNKKRRDSEKKLKEMKDTMQQLFGKSTLSSKETVRRTQKMQKVTEFWKTISTLYESQKVLQEEIQHLVNGTFVKKSLDGEQINFKIPDILVRECEQELYKGRKYHNVYEGGKINLTSLIQLWNLSLHLIKEMLHQYPLPDLEHDEAYLRAESHNHANSLNNLTSMRTSVSKQMLPDINLSIDELKETILEKTSTKTPNMNKFGLDLLPATPPVFFDVEEKIPKHGTPGQIHKSNNYVPTPDAVNTLLDAIKKDSQFNEDGTPVRRLPTSKKVASSVKKTEKSTTNPGKKIQQIRSKHRTHQSRIPLSKSKQDSLSTKTLFETKRKDKIKELHREINTTRANSKKKTDIQEWYDNNNETKHDLVKAQELLIDQITRSVLNTGNTPSRSSTDEEDNKISSRHNRNTNRKDVLQTSFHDDIHALDNPLEAFSSEAFTSRDKVPRTPLKREVLDSSTNDKGDIYIPEGEILPIYEDTELISKSEASQKEQDDIGSLKERLTRLNIGVDKNTNASEEKTFDLSALQEKINTIKLRGLHNEYTSDFTTPKQNNSRKNITTPLDKIVSPLHEPSTSLTATEVTTPLSTAAILNFVTPLHDLSVCNSYNDTTDKFEGSQNSIATPVNQSPEEYVNSFSPDGDKTPVPTENNNQSTQELLHFTPAQTNERADRTQKVDLFLENNPHLLDRTPKMSESIQSTQYDSSSYHSRNLLDTTPVCSLKETFHSPLPSLSIDDDVNEILRTPIHIPKDKLINFITPFKDPFTPSENSDTLRRSVADVVSPNKFDVTAEEVDDFIHEVMAKTPAFSTASNDFMKTPKMFRSNTPLFSNDYSLMTPGKGLSNKLLDDNNDDDEI